MNPFSNLYIDWKSYVRCPGIKIYIVRLSFWLVDQSHSFVSNLQNADALSISFRFFQLLIQLNHFWPTDAYTLLGHCYDNSVCLLWQPNTVAEQWSAEQNCRKKLIRIAPRMKTQVKVHVRRMHRFSATAHAQSYFHWLIANFAEWLGEWATVLLFM